MYTSVAKVYTEVGDARGQRPVRTRGAARSRNRSAPMPKQATVTNRHAMASGLFSLVIMNCGVCAQVYRESSWSPAVSLWPGSCTMRSD
jgi:hypothetical protein